MGTVGVYKKRLLKIIVVLCPSWTMRVKTVARQRKMTRRCRSWCLAWVNAYMTFRVIRPLYCSLYTTCCLVIWGPEVAIHALHDWSVTGRGHTLLSPVNSNRPLWESKLLSQNNTCGKGWAECLRQKTEIFFLQNWMSASSEQSKFVQGRNMSLPLSFPSCYVPHTHFSSCRLWSQILYTFLSGIFEQLTANVKSGQLLTVWHNSLYYSLCWCERCQTSCLALFCVRVSCRTKIFAN